MNKLRSVIKIAIDTRIFSDMIKSRLRFADTLMTNRESKL